MAVERMQHEIKALASLRVGLSLAVAYVITGWLGLQLAVPPGYASAIFPPAGISAAAALIIGRMTLPWTFIGSLLLNLSVGYSVNHGFTTLGLLAAIDIAAASTIQAGITGWVLRRAIDYPAPLDNSGDLRRFVLLSPVCCLVSATLALSGLWALGVVKTLDLSTSWISWWIGDTLGVVLVLPLMLVVAGEPRALWRSRLYPVAVPILLFFALFVAIFMRVSQWEHDASLLEFRLTSQQVADKVHNALEEQGMFLDQLARSLGRPPMPSQADFQNLVEGLLKRFPTVQAVEWAPRVTAEERDAFEAAQQAGSPQFEIRQLDAAGRLIRAEDRDQFFPVTYVAPLEGNQRAVGFDLFSESARRAAVQAAIGAPAATASAPIRLVQDQTQQNGVLLARAVPNSARPSLVLVVLKMGPLMSALLTGAAPTLDARLIDIEGGVTLYDGFGADSASPLSTQIFAVGGRQYQLNTVPTALYLATHHGLESWAVLVIGTFSTGLLGALLLLATGHRRRVETTVVERTRELATVNQRLTAEMEERRQAEAALRQAQRMEAIGQITGGVAHDFNNLITVVRGNAELLHDRATDDVTRRRADAIALAADRGQRLTRQLLTFSRRQTLRPEPMNLRERTGEIAELLSRSLRGDIDLVITLPGELWPVAVDSAEFELALLNIGVNARDAMPAGGCLRVEAKNVSFPPSTPGGTSLNGDFVALTISDTGTGMAPEVLAHAFEPYFTTKDVETGSGLGLSQVYGFAVQSGGMAELTSEVGKGTSITLHLPRAQTVSPFKEEQPDAPLPAAAQSLKILVVEDDEDVAVITTDMLRDLGYRVERANNAVNALTALEADDTFGLVFSDIVMPGGMSGLELARSLRQRYPKLPVILTTGFSRYASEGSVEGFQVVEKPFRRAALSAAITNAIEGLGERLPLIG